MAFLFKGFYHIWALKPSWSCEQQFEKNFVFSSDRGGCMIKYGLNRPSRGLKSLTDNKILLTLKEKSNHSHIVWQYNVSFCLFSIFDRF